MRPFFRHSLLYFAGAGLITCLCGWGFYTHQTTTQLAVYKLPRPVRSFFFAHIDTLTRTSIRPDQRRSSDKNEFPKHFIDLEDYGPGAVLIMPREVTAAVEKYSWDTLKKYGYVPYQVLIEYDSLVNAIKRQQADSIIYYAADLAHYIEDACVPLHTTTNYDGQLTGQKGLHALWETTIPELNMARYDLYAGHKAVYLPNKSEAIWMAVKRAHALLPEMLMKEKEVAAGFPDSSKYMEKMYYGRKTVMYTEAFARQYAAALTSTINDQLTYSANLVADFWYSAWVDAGRPPLKKLFSRTAGSNKQLRRELKSYKQNKLLEDGVLRANRE